MAIGIRKPVRGRLCRFSVPLLLDPLYRLRVFLVTPFLQMVVELNIWSGLAGQGQARNRMFTEPDGPSLDAGPFVVALEYACARSARLLGKPAPAFFLEALNSLGLPPAEVAMIGDDAESDIAGAMAVGCRGILAQTGKYRPEDETRIIPAPDAVVADLTEAVAWLLER